MKYLFWISILFVSFSCATMDTGSQTDKTIDFSKYRSYAWQLRKKDDRKTNSRVDNELAQTKIREQINKELMARGYNIDTLSPDLLVDFTIRTEERVENIQEPIYASPYWYGPSIPMWGYYSPFYLAPGASVYGYRSIKNKYQYGKITVYVIDRVKNRLVWQGWADGAIDDPETFERELPKNIDTMFKDYPVKKE